MAVERKYERDIDILLAEEFAVSPVFANWFLTKSKSFKDSEAVVEAVYVSDSDNKGESDLVVVYNRADRSGRFALLIEDKIDAPLQPKQEERYRMRADAEIYKGAEAKYMQADVILCAPAAYPVRHPEVSTFDGFVSYQDIAEFLEQSSDVRSRYRAEFIKTAAQRNINAWTPIADSTTDCFWDAVYEIATDEFPELEMKQVRFTKDNAYIRFRPRGMQGMPHLTYVEVKGSKGHVDLTFSGCNNRSFQPLIKHLLEEGMSMHQGGAASLIRISVVPFEVNQAIDKEMPLVKAALVGAARLVSFYRANQPALDDAVSNSAK